MQRRPEPELMDLPAEAAAYAGADFSPVNSAFVARLLELTRGRGAPAARVIDLGTGPGDIAFRIAWARPTWSVTAIDASEAMLAIAREQASDERNLSFVLADAKASGFPDRSFDVIFSNSLLHHMPDPLPLWREIKRLAAPRALIFVRDLLRPESEADARRLVELHGGGESALLQQEFHRSFLAAFTVDEIRRQLEAAGLANLKIEPSSDRHVDVYGIAG
jgi:ubiquinone/menaquinone biosynthesis C-methylase UbiE